jgi:hypothetical protein
LVGIYKTSRMNKTQDDTPATLEPSWMPTTYADHICRPHMPTTYADHICRPLSYIALHKPTSAVRAESLCMTCNKAWISSLNWPFVVRFCEQASLAIYPYFD